jgi:FkbM family methyltransferase
MIMRLTKIWNKLRKVSCRILFHYDYPSKTKIHKVSGLKRIGSNYGGWYIPQKLLSSDSVCYCFGIGEDISFDIGLIKRFNCDVYSFDPTPRVKKFLEKEANGISKFHFFPIGLWNQNESVKFYTPKNDQDISHSIVNLQDTTDFFMADCKTLQTIMNMLGHKKINMLKMDIEGAEYAVIKNIIDNRISIDCLNIEFHYNNRELLEKLRKIVNLLTHHGYELVFVDTKMNYTFLKLKS